MTEKTKEDKKEKREIVIPGDIVGKGDDMLPGDWVTKDGDNLISTRLGLCDKSDRLVKIIPISGVYMPRRGNVVIATISDFTMRGWITTIGSPYEAFLQLSECPMFVREDEMQELYDIGDLIIAKISKVGRGSIDLTLKGRGLGKIKQGIVMNISPNRVPRVIGKEGSMVRIIKLATDTEVTVGQNGLIWIKGNSTEDELFAKEVINFVIDNITTEGLTEKVEEWLKKNKKTSEKKETNSKKAESKETKENKE